MGVILIPFATAWSSPEQGRPGDGMSPPGDCSKTEWKALDVAASKACRVKRNCDSVTDCAELIQRIALFNACINARLELMKKCFRGGDSEHNRIVDKERAGKATCEAKLAQCIKVCPR
jgi:hypothetical protein